MIQEGDRFPDAVFVVMGASGPEVTTAQQLFPGRRVALFGLPGAYTPVCHREHLPGIVAMHDALKHQGIDIVACTAVNDVFVLDRWVRDFGAEHKLTMLADGNADFAEPAGLTVDLRRYGLGVRSRRYAMIVIDGIIRVLNVEAEITEHGTSSALEIARRISQSRSAA